MQTPDRFTRFGNPWTAPVVPIVIEARRPEKRGRNPFFDLLASPKIPDPTPEQTENMRRYRRAVYVESIIGKEKRKAEERAFQRRDKLRELGIKI
ncbi:MAG: hypothetical protein AAB353_11240 [Candidatus Hydrogenedentota bacterium]